MHAGYGLVAVVLVYSVVQSVFGVGLLVFGTPTLLLTGFSFEETLAYLLPCSIVISTLQVRDGGCARPSSRSGSCTGCRTSAAGCSP